MSRWWRAYDEAVDDPKLQRLPAELFRGWFNLCCITSQNGGSLPPISDVAFKLRLSEAKAQQIIDQLLQVGLLDETGEGCRPHNWEKRQYKTDNDDPTNSVRQKRYRERHRNANSNGHRNGSNSVTLSGTVTHPETEQRQKQKQIKDPSQGRIVNGLGRAHS